MTENKNNNQIMTVTGPVNADDLGFCQSHEHLALRMGRSYEVHHALLIDDEKKSTEEACSLVKAGGGTIIDAQPVGCGRMDDMLLAISKASGLHIIASTGFHKMTFYPEDHWIRTISEQDLCDLFVFELTTGMFHNADEKQPDLSGDGYGASKAGQIKTALDSVGLTDLYRKLFAAAAAACLKTDAPIMIHIEKGSDPLELFDYLRAYGVPAKRLIFCHMDRAVSDLSVHKELLSQGAFLEYDTIGRFKYHSDEHETDIIMEMLKSGFEDQILFSLDTTRERLISYDPKAVGLTYILKTFLPLLKISGATDEQIRKISHDNLIRVYTA